MFKSLGRATAGYGVQYVLKNEIIAALVKPQMRIDAPETVEAAPEPKQLELLSAAPQKAAKSAKLKEKAEKKKAPPVKAKAKSKK